MIEVAAWLVCILICWLTAAMVPSTWATPFYVIAFLMTAGILLEWLSECL